MKRMICALFALMLIAACGAKKEIPEDFKEYAFEGGFKVYLPVEKMDFVAGDTEEIVEEAKEMNPEVESIESYSYVGANEAADIGYHYSYIEADADVFEDNMDIYRSLFSKTEELKINGKNCAILTKQYEDNRLDILLCTTKTQQWMLQIESKSPVTFAHQDLGEGNFIEFHDDSAQNNRIMEDIVKKIINTVEIR